MRKIFRFCFMFFLLVFPFMVKASSVSINCSDIATSNSLSCDITGNTDKVISAVSAKVRSNSNLSFSSFKPSSIWQGDGSDGSIDLYTAEDVTGDFGIGSLSLNVASVEEGYNSSVILESVSFYDIDGNEIKVEKTTKNIRIASSINNLSSLSINSGNLNPTFNKNTTFYSSTIDSNSVIISAISESSYAKISGDVGEKKLNYGNNLFKIDVTSENGNVKTYTINIVRLDNKKDNNSSNNNTDKTNSKSNNANLKDIVLDIGNINFHKNILTYDINVSYDIKKIDVNAVAEDSKAKIEISGNDDLKVGENKIVVKVIAEDNTTKEYIINVIRKEEGYQLSNNSNVLDIKIKNYKLKFNKDIMDYTLNIKNEKQLDIKVLLEDSKAKYEIFGNNNLKNNSVIKINVKAEDNSSRVYTIKINKSGNKEVAFIIIISLLLLINIGRIGFKALANIKSVNTKLKND